MSAAWLAPAAVAAPSSAQVELVVSADRAVWKPKGGALSGTLTLRDVSPRMAVFATAPRTETSVVPAGQLASYWSQLFAKSKAKGTKGKRVTNGLVEFGAGDDRRLIPVQLELVGSYQDGSRLVFRVRPLKQSSHRTDILGTKGTTFEDVTILVDPTITDFLKSLWNALFGVFTSDPQIPDDPVDEAANGDKIFNAVADPIDDDGYAGEQFVRYTSMKEWVGAARGNWDAAGGSYQSDLDETTLGGATFARFTGNQYEGLALFDHTFNGEVSFQPAGGAGTLVGSALYKVEIGSLSIANTDAGGMNMRGLNAGDVSIQDSALVSADMTGARLGVQDARSTVQNSVFKDVNANVAGNDGVTDGLNGASYGFANVDFVGVGFDGVTLRRGVIGGSTFQACSFEGVDLSASAIVGADAGPGGRFQQTFDGSMFRDTKFEGARLENVSFAGVDFSGGGVSLDGAILKNVDFTGAVGLQFVDWTTVTVDGNVYGLSSVASQLSTELRDHPEYLRTLTFDGVIPEIDAATGFDVQPGTPYLIDPASGVRLEAAANGQLAPVDPATGERLTDVYGDPLVWSADRGLTDPLGNRYAVDYASGRVEGRI